MTIRYFLLGLVLTVTGCTGQPTSNNQVAIDTLKLFDPKQETVDNSLTAMLQNFALLNQNPYVLTIQGKNLLAKSDDEFFDKIKANKLDVAKSKFYIIVDSSFSFSKIVGVIGKLKETGITDYKVIDFDSHFKTTISSKVELPTVTKNTVNANDSSSFSITILDDTFTASLLNKKYTFKTGLEIDKFIKANKTVINSDKILVIGKANTSFKKFKPILDVLKKYDYYNFQIVTQ